jgi:hypothetical protein
MIGEWMWKDSATGKTSSTKITQVVVVFGVVILCIIWAIQGDLTFAKGKDFVMWMFGIQTTNNLGSRGIKAWTLGSQSKEEPERQKERRTEQPELEEAHLDEDDEELAYDER